MIFAALLIRTLGVTLCVAGTNLTAKEKLFCSVAYLPKATVQAAIGSVPLAMGLFIPVLGWKLNPMFGAAAMSLSSFCVVSNALRLNFFDLHRADRDRKIKAEKKKKEKKIMEKTLKIEGMMCGHCEARVKKALEAVSGVESAAVSHEAGTAVVTLKEDVAYDVLKKAVEDQDYKVID